MADRFSIARVLRELGRMLGSCWRELLALALIFAALLYVGSVFVTSNLGVDRLHSPSLRMATDLFDLVFRILITSLILHLVFVGKGQGVALPATLRTALLRLGAIALAVLLFESPRLLFKLGIELWFAGGGQATDEAAYNVPQLSIAVSGVSLVLFSFFGAAPSVMVAERLPLKPALSRALALTHERSLLLCIVYLIGYFVAAIPGALVFLVNNFALETFPASTGRVGVGVVALGLVKVLTEIVKVLAVAAVFVELRRLNDPLTAS